MKSSKKDKVYNPPTLILTMQDEKEGSFKRNKQLIRNREIDAMVEMSRLYPVN
jgi:hypothetical protein